MLKQKTLIYLCLFFLSYPLWSAEFQWGVGSLNFKAHHYRGSREEKSYFIPLPYFRYTSEKIQAEPSFIKGVFYRDDKISLNLSLHTGLSVESNQNLARSGMPKLKRTSELGPMFSVKLWSCPSLKRQLYFKWPFRMVNTLTLSSLKRVGFMSAPHLNLVQEPTSHFFHWSLEYSLALMWGSQKYHNFYYGVEPTYATAARPAYEASRGYSGLQNALILKKQWKNFIFLPFFRWDLLNEVAFRESPLFQTKSYFLAGLGFFILSP